MRLRTHLLLGVVLFVFATFAVVVPAAAQAPTKIVIGQSFVSPAAAAFWVSRDQKLFAKYGLDVTIVLFRGSTQAIQALLAGENQFMLGAPSQGITANAAGADLISIATTGPKMPYLLLTRPEIKSPADLKGKRVGASSTGLSADRAAMLIALKHLRLDPKRDNITFIVAGTQSERVQALAAGSIDASLNDHVQKTIAERLGMKVMMDLSTLDIPWDHDVVLLQRQYAKSNPGVVEALLKAYLEASAFILNPANKKAVISSLAKDMKLDKEGDIELAYHLTTTQYVVKKPYPSMKAAKALVEAVSDDFPQFGKVNLETHVDTSFMEKLDKSGFIDQLYQKR